MRYKYSNVDISTEEGIKQAEGLQEKGYSFTKVQFSIPSQSNAVINNRHRRTA